MRILKPANEPRERTEKEKELDRLFALSKKAEEQNEPIEAARLQMEMIHLKKESE